MKIIAIFLAGLFRLWVLKQFLEPLDTVAGTIFIVLIISAILHVRGTRTSPNQLELVKKIDVPIKTNLPNTNQNKKDLTKSDALSILNSRKLVNKPGKYQLKVESVVNYVMEEYGQALIVNLSAMSELHVSEAKRMFKDGEYQKAVNSHFSSLQRVGKDYLPVKDETVIVVIDYNNQADINSLKVLSLIELKVEKAYDVKLKGLC